MSKLESVMTEAALKVDIGGAKWFTDASGRIVFPVFGKERSPDPEYALYLLDLSQPHSRATTILVKWLDLAAIDFDPLGAKKLLEQKIKEATQ